MSNHNQTDGKPIVQHKFHLSYPILMSIYNNSTSSTAIFYPVPRPRKTIHIINTSLILTQIHQPSLHMTYTNLLPYKPFHQTRPHQTNKKIPLPCPTSPENYFQIPHQSHIPEAMSILHLPLVQLPNLKSISPTKTIHLKFTPSDF